ncbi:MAG: peptidoglycan editing factor PgeF [Phycisphaeraceae bacterium]
MPDLIRVQHDNGVVTYQSPLLSEAGVPHGFTTRIGGISPAPFDTLNLAAMVNDPASDASTNVAENFRRVRTALGCRRHIRVQVNQVHGREVWVPPAHPVRPVDAPRADAIATDKPGLMLMVRVADCVPVLLASRDGRVVAAVHAGWRGVVAGVVTNAVREVETLAGPGHASDLVAAVGPCIGPDRFEVGPEVAEAFESVGLQDAIVEYDNAKPHIHLSQAVAHQLIQTGIDPGRIDRTDRCTYNESQEFFSHRRDRGRTGRQAALIAVRP